MSSKRAQAMFCRGLFCIIVLRNCLFSCNPSKEDIYANITPDAPPFCKNFIKLSAFSAALFLFVSAETSNEEMFVVLRDQGMARLETGTSARQTVFSATHSSIAASGAKFVSIYSEIT